MLAASDRAESPPAPAPNAEEAADGALRDLNRRFARETARRERSEARASQLAAALQKSDDALRQSMGAQALAKARRDFSFAG